MNELNHFDETGQAHMVDITAKDATRRQAIAEGSISLSEKAFTLLQNTTDNRKGDVLGIARIAAIQGAKQTAQLIPLCHALMLTHISICFFPDEQNLSLRMQAKAETTGQTGVEMEALTAVSVGLLTVYDMLKSVDKSMVISNIHLIEKQGGKSGDYFVRKHEPSP